MALLMARKLQQRGFHHSKIIMFDTDGLPLSRNGALYPTNGIGRI